jgi:exopolysaccharide production protein ExoQ
MLSTAWSDEPTITFKQSLELLLTIGLAVAACSRFEARGLAGAALVSGVAFCLLSIIYQRQNLGQTLVGLTASKNSMAFASQLVLLAGLFTAVDRQNPMLLRIFAVAGCGLGILCVVLAKSAGVWVTAAAAIATFLALTASSRVSFGARVIAAVIVLLSVAPLAVAFKDVVDVVQTFQTGILHKDATITGRTELWHAARSVIAENPVLGHGYAAFWQPKNVDAVALAQTTNAVRHIGFNFHDQFVDAWVDMGVVGMVLLTTVLAFVGGVMIWRALRAPDLENAFLVALLLALYLRLPIESTLIGAWNLSTFLWITAGVSACVGRARIASAPIRSSSVGETWRASHQRLRAAGSRSGPELGAGSP